MPLLVEAHATRQLLGVAVCTYDLRSHFVLLAVTEAVLIDSEVLDGRLFECAAEPGEWVAIVEVLELALVLAQVPRGAEAGHRSARDRAT
jgi:hypothetical protein